MRITDWPAAEPPREKLLAKDPRALSESEAELLAIFLRTGVKGKRFVVGDGQVTSFAERGWL